MHVFKIWLHISIISRTFHSLLESKVRVRRTLILMHNHSQQDIPILSKRAQTLGIFKSEQGDEMNPRSSEEMHYQNLNKIKICKKIM